MVRLTSGRYGWGECGVKLVNESFMIERPGTAPVRQNRASLLYCGSPADRTGKESGWPKATALTAATQPARTGPGWLLWLLYPHHVNYHVEHHMYPAIPHYNLPACHREMMARGILDRAEVLPVFGTLRRIFGDPRMEPLQNPA